MARIQEKKLQRKIISLLKKNKNPILPREIKKSLGLTKKNDRYFKNAIGNLIQTGRISKKADGIAIISSAGRKNITGTVRITRGGFGFVREINSKSDILKIQNLMLMPFKLQNH